MCVLTAFTLPRRTSSDAVTSSCRLPLANHEGSIAFDCFFRPTPQGSSPLGPFWGDFLGAGPFNLSRRWPGRQRQKERNHAGTLAGTHRPLTFLPLKRRLKVGDKQVISASSRVKGMFVSPGPPLSNIVPYLVPYQPRHGVHEACFVSPGGCSKSSSIFRLPRRRSISGLCDLVGLEYIHYIQHHGIVTCSPSFSVSPTSPLPLPHSCAYY